VCICRRRTISAPTQGVPPERAPYFPYAAVRCEHGVSCSIWSWDLHATLRSQQHLYQHIGAYLRPDPASYPIDPWQFSPLRVRRCLVPAPGPASREKTAGARAAATAMNREPLWYLRSHPVSLTGLRNEATGSAADSWPSDRRTPKAYETVRRGGPKEKLAKMRCYRRWQPRSGAR